MSKENKYTAETITEITTWAPNLFSFKLTRFSGYRFIPGQFSRLGIKKEDRDINSDFILNNKPYSESKILLTRDNFGCGSSREHAVWALRDFGIKAVIASSFGDIFYNNCFKNGVLPIKLDKNQIEQIFVLVKEDAVEFSIDLQKRIIHLNDNNKVNFINKSFDHFS